MPTRSLRHQAARARRRRRLLLVGSALGLSAAAGGSAYFLVSGHRLDRYLASSAQTATTLGDARPCPVVQGTASPAAAGSPAAASPGAASPGPANLTSHRSASPGPASRRSASPGPASSATSRRSATPGPASFTASPAPGSQPTAPLPDCPQAPALVGPGSASRGPASPGSASPARPPGRPVASPSPSPSPSLATPPAAPQSPAAYAAVQQVLTLINQTRIQQELPPYTLSSALSRSAARHTALMAAGCGLSHQCPGEPALGARETAAGARWTAAGENIGEGGPEPATAAAIASMATTLTQDMLNERAPDDGHRRNLLSSTFRHIGIAIVRDDSGAIWLTQDFSN